MLMSRLFLYLFLLMSVGEITSTLIDAPILHAVCKPSLMLTLGMYYWLTIRQHQSGLSIAVVLAILFSGAGDVLLMFQQDNPLYFMLGLGTFLTAHVFYILAYRQHRHADNAKALRGLQKIRFAFPVVLAGFGLVSILYSHLGELKAPVMVYAILLTIMVLTALFRFGRTSASSFAMVFGGAILFMISDSLLAINKFLEPLPLESFWIMTTYINAQYLIVRGLIKHP
jgi:uncharacterized membrane protein YhhN